MSNAVNRISAAPSAQALQHFEAGFGFEKAHFCYQ